ncbi:MAG TPA: type II secretion system F family protein [Candidatus Saccharimonadales bacterium]|jgi:type II secretory pathway component PulF|nr:type II secretion system F family protein [Candidatus Saccharimonadales bacterium]
MTTPKAVKEPKKGGLNRVYFSFKEREFFTENLALLLKAAVPIGQAFGSLLESARSSSMKKSIIQMQADVEAGYSLSGLLERSGVVTGQTLALVQLGEQSGHLVENLELAAKQEEKRHIFRSKVRSALLYPVFVMGLTLLVGLAVAWFLLPRLAVTFSQLDVKLPLISKIFLGLGLFLKDHGFIAVPIFLIVLAAAGYLLFVAPKTKGIGTRLLFILPGISRMMREVEIAQFGYLLGTLLDAGLPVTKAIKLLADSSNAPQYRAFYEYLAASLADGFSFKQSIAQYKKVSKLFPPAVQQMVIAGERSGALSEVLLTIGRTYEQKSDITTANLEAILEPILLIMVSLGVMAVAVAVILPIYSLVGGLHG